MKLLLVSAAAVLVTSGVPASAVADSLQALRRVEKADPRSDLKRALARRDLRFKAFGGNGIQVPGSVDERYVVKYGVDYLWYGDVVFGYEHGRLLAIARYYADTYNGMLADHIGKVEARALAVGLAGYRDMAGAIAIERVDIGNFNGLPTAMHAMLKSLRPRCADRAWWFDPLKDGKPAYDWHQFLAVYLQADEAVCSHAWIGDWIRAGPNRHAEAHILGIDPHAEAGFETFVKAAWQTAGIGSEPHFQIILRQGDDYFVSLYVSKDMSMALVDSKSEARKARRRQVPLKPRHWLDELAPFSYHPKSPYDFVVVDQTGRWRKGN